MKTLLQIFLGLMLISMTSNACDTPEQDVSNTEPNTHQSTEATIRTSFTSDEYVLDASSVIACENYLKGRTFQGNSARLKFEYDGTVSAFDQSGNLLFGGTLEIGEAKSAVSRWIYIRNMAGAGKLQFLLSNDGKMMEPSSLVMYNPI